MYAMRERICGSQNKTVGRLVWLGHTGSKVRGHEKLKKHKDARLCRILQTMLQVYFILNRGQELMGHFHGY